MPRFDLLDISHHNTVTRSADIGSGPIFHKVNEGRALDSKIKARLPWLADRPRWGGYTVLLPEAPGRSTIRQQIEQYAEIVGPYWRPGAGTQLDVESWWHGGDYRYGRPVTAGEVSEAIAVHIELLGRVPFVYMNRNEPGMADVFRAWRSTHPTHPYWLPHYGRAGAATAVELRADVWQWSAAASHTGIIGGCDANEVINPAALDLVCGIRQPEEPTMPPSPPPYKAPLTPALEAFAVVAAYCASNPGNGAQGALWDVVLPHMTGIRLPAGDRRRTEFEQAARYPGGGRLDRAWDAVLAAGGR